MIVAELIASGELVNPHEMAESRGGAALPMRLGGLRLNPGLAVAPALLHEPSVVIRHIVAEDIEAEERRLLEAVAAMQQGIDQLVDATSGLGTGEHREILEAYRMFATDRGWLARMTEAVRSGLTAEAAVQKVRDETKSRLMQVTDPYLRERLYDLEDLANRLQQCLVGPPGGRPPARVPDRIHPGRRGDGTGRAAGIRAASHQGPRARTRLADDACRDRRAGPRHSGGRPGRRRDPCRRAGRPPRRRRRQRQRAGSPARRYPAVGRGSGRDAHPAPRLLRDAARHPGGYQGRGRDRAAAECRAAARRRRSSTPPGRPASGCFAPRYSCWRATRSPKSPSRPRFTAAPSNRPASGRSCSARSISAATRCCRTSRKPPRTTRRWAGARSASGSTGRRCCGGNCGRCCAPPPGGSCASSSR